MIELKVEDYCHKCCQFEPEITKDSLFGDGLFVYDCRTTITCKHEAVCKYITNINMKEAE